MRNPSLKKRRLFFVFSILLFLVSSLLPFHSARAYPTSSKDAEAVVRNWLALSPAPLGKEMAAPAPAELISRVETFVDESESDLFYVVYIIPKGFVIVPADDSVEPIIAFLPSALHFDPSDDNPLGALVASDIPGRLNAAKEINRSPSVSETAHAAERKWDFLLDPGKERTTRGVSSINDERVAPLVQSQWNQGSVSGYCYNYYTPNHYVTGCVATAMAQILRFYQRPTYGVGTGTYTIKVDNVSQDRSLRGGDGAGGSYNWADMPLTPDGSISETQRQAIGALTHDAGVSVNMSYSSSGSSASTLEVAERLVDLFGYGNAIKGHNYDQGWQNIPSDILNNMVIPSLDAGSPVIFGVSRPGGGHAVLCDGYGYNASTLYHHLNLGWGGSSDAWYNLPTIDAGSSYTYDTVKACIYNIFTSGSGEIISGRVTDNAGAPLAGVAVSATPGGGTDATDSNGIYALAKIASNTPFTLTATKSGYVFSQKQRTTGYSNLVDFYSPEVGNVRGVNFLAWEGCLWSGAAGEDWNLDGNWSDAVIPDDETDVLISNATNQPTIRLSAECSILVIEEGGTLTLEDDVLTIM